MSDLKYSWIFPVYNEDSSLPRLLFEIEQAMPTSDWEIIAIDDCSEDQSLQILKELSKKISQLKILHLNPHQGKWAALSLGFQKAKGEVFITLDSDLQDNPAEIKKLLNKLEQGYDLISGWRRVRHDSFYKVIISKLGNWLASILTSHNFKDLNSPFKVYRREVLESLPKQGSLFRFAMLFAVKLDFKVCEVPVKHRSRLFGKSKFGLLKYIRIVYDLILILLLFSGSGRLKRLKI